MKVNYKIWFSALLIFNLLAWSFVYEAIKPKVFELYFLSVGQGDGSLVILPGSAGKRIKVLIDGGPPNLLVQKNLEKILPVDDHYIDLAIISHPQLDHFGGLIDLFKNYRIGAVLMSRLDRPQVSWQELKRVIKEKNIKTVIIEAGDAIKYKNFSFDILSPKQSDYGGKINDAAIVFNLVGNGAKAFFGGDISAKKEEDLIKRYQLSVDILKVDHHGSKYSSSGLFLEKLRPKISVIEVGKNSYGHPTKQALNRLASVGSGIFRTDRNGLIRIIIDNGKLEVFTEK